MKSDILFDYIVKGFNKWVKEPLNNASQRIRNKNGIILYVRPPNATHLIEAADVNIFQLFKSKWKNSGYECELNLKMSTMY